jgi:hypothetical protein
MLGSYKTPISGEVGRSIQLTALECMSSRQHSPAAGPISFFKSALLRRERLRSRTRVTWSELGRVYGLLSIFETKFPQLRFCQTFCHSKRVCVLDYRLLNAVLDLTCDLRGN